MCRIKWIIVFNSWSFPLLCDLIIISTFSFFASSNASRDLWKAGPSISEGFLLNAVLMRPIPTPQ